VNSSSGVSSVFVDSRIIVARDWALWGAFPQSFCTSKRNCKTVKRNDCIVRCYAYLLLTLHFSNHILIGCADKYIKELQQLLDLFGSY
jgi:hypothetical protein